MNYNIMHSEYYFVNFTRLNEFSIIIDTITNISSVPDPQGLFTPNGGI